MFLVKTGRNDSRNSMPLDKTNFAPRIGLAYSLNPKTVDSLGVRNLLDSELCILQRQSEQRYSRSRDQRVHGFDRRGQNLRQQDQQSIPGHRDCPAAWAQLSSRAKCPDIYRGYRGFREQLLRPPCWLRAAVELGPSARTAGGFLR